jgi:hypothetical protein
MALAHARGLGDARLRQLVRATQREKLEGRFQNALAHVHIGNATKAAVLSLLKDKCALAIVPPG